MSSDNKTKNALLKSSQIAVAAGLGLAAFTPLPKSGVGHDIVLVVGGIVIVLALVFFLNGRQSNSSKKTNEE